jgi:hypothetical protein
VDGGIALLEMTGAKVSADGWQDLSDKAINRPSKSVSVCLHTDNEPGIDESIHVH